jgi:hypothetical protein
MPVEIRELVIKAVVVDGTHRATSDNNETTGVAAAQIVERCVSEVLKILKNSKNR